MTRITQVKRKTTAATKLSSLHFCLFFFHWVLSPGRKLSVLTLRASSEHLSIVYLQTAHSFNANLTAEMIDSLWRWGFRIQRQQWFANEQTMEDIRLIVNIIIPWSEQSVASPFIIHNQLCGRWLPVAWFGIPTRRLEVEPSQLHRVSGVMQRHFLAVGETAFSSFRFCSFSAEQTVN